MGGSKIVLELLKTGVKVFNRLVLLAKFLDGLGLGGIGELTL